MRRTEEVEFGESTRGVGVVRAHFEAGLHIGGLLRHTTVCSTVIRADGAGGRQHVRVHDSDGAGGTLGGWRRLYKSALYGRASSKKEIRSSFDPSDGAYDWPAWEAVEIRIDTIPWLYNMVERESRCVFRPRWLLLTFEVSYFRLFLRFGWGV